MFYRELLIIGVPLVLILLAVVTAPAWAPMLGSFLKGLSNQLNEGGKSIDKKFSGKSKK